VEDKAHGNDIGLGEVVLEEVEVLNGHAGAQVVLSNILLSHKANSGKVASREPVRLLKLKGHINNEGVMRGTSSQGGVSPPHSRELQQSHQCQRGFGTWKNQTSQPKQRI
jgi:hypothetical protein